MIGPDVYPFAARLARYWGCSHVVALGPDGAPGFEESHPEFRLVRLDPDDAAPAIFARSVIVSAGLIERQGDPLPALRNLRRLLDLAPVALLTAPGDFPELEQLLQAAGLRNQFVGLTASHDDGLKGTILALLESPAGSVPARKAAPAGFHAVALMPTFNEEDVVESSILALADEGVETYVIDNWSTDATPAIVERLLGRGAIGMERFPANGATRYSEWRRILRRMEELTLVLDADWFLHVDADERPRSPWPRVSLRDALSFVGSCGFNSVDHTTLTFQPVDDTFHSGDPESHFRCYQFGQDWSDFQQVKAWRNLGVPIVRAHGGGHDTAFAGKRVYPYKFLLKHYPIRSQAHGERKVHRERVARWSPRERAAGWHVHYDEVGLEHRFVRDAAELLQFEEERFNREFLVERLSGIGVPRLAAARASRAPRVP